MPRFPSSPSQAIITNQKKQEGMEKGESSSGADSNNRPWQSYHTVYTNAKAGMDGVDKEKVQRIVYETSKGSKYFENEERKEAFMWQKIDNMRARCAKLLSADISHYQMLADKRISELEATRDLSRIWLHVDMDAFYAAVETLSNPSLKGKPMAVGSMSMISTANYEARRFGVRAAMPGFIARKLCPGLIFIPIDFKKYTYYSDLTRKVFKKYDPHFMSTSLDEAYLDITEICKQKGMTGGKVAEELRTSVYEETGLTCSAGVAPNRLLAKVCSDINKPNGQFVLPNDRLAVMTFISSLPIRKIGGIGKVTEHILRDALGINTCEEMLQKGGFLSALFSHSTADFFLSVGLGIGKTDTPQVSFRKSISSERTFSATDNEALLYQKLADIAHMLCTDMQKEGLCGRTLTLKLKTSSFEVRSRALTLQRYICASEDILKYASELLKAELPISLRLIGLRVSHFNEDKVGASPDPTQKTLTNFIKSGEESRKNLGDQSCLGSDFGEQHFKNDNETGLPIDSHDMHHCKIGDPLDGNNLRYPDDHHCTSSTNSKMEKIHGTLSNIITNQVNAVMERYSSECHQTELSHFNEAESSLPRHLGGSSLDIVNMEVRDNELVSSSEQRDQVCWVDGYRCSLCGIEMPHEFVEERQEHSDFHLAERLQTEECSTSSRTPMLRQRVVQKDRLSSRSTGKKRKLSPKKGSHLSIDMFFVKSNQNF